MVEQIFQLVGVELFIAHKIKDHARVEIARARPHGYAPSGSEAHRSIDRDSVSQRTQARPISEVRKYGSWRKLRAEMMHERFIRNAVEAIAPNPRVEVALREREMRCGLRNRLVKSVVKAGVVCSRGEDRLRGSDKRKRLWNVQRRKVGCGAQLMQDIWRNELVFAQPRPAVHYAVADGYRSCMNMLPDCDSEKFECMTLRLVNAVALHQRCSIGRTNMQGAVAVPNTVGASGQQRFFIARPTAVNPELQRRRAAVEHEDQIVVIG